MNTTLDLLNQKIDFHTARIAEDIKAEHEKVLEAKWTMNTRTLYVKDVRGSWRKVPQNLVLSGDEAKIRQWIVKNKHLFYKDI